MTNQMAMRQCHTVISNHLSCINNHYYKHSTWYYYKSIYFHRWLMTEDKSPIKDLYLSDIPIDPNGKHLPWLWILLLPFIEAKRISHAFETCKHLLTLEERRRNVFSGAYIFVHSQKKLAQNLVLKKDFHYRPEKERNPEILEAMKNVIQKSISNVNGNTNGKMKFENEILCIDNGGDDENENESIMDDDDSNVEIITSANSNDDIAVASHSSTVSSSSVLLSSNNHNCSSSSDSIETSQQLVTISTADHSISNRNNNNNNSVEDEDEDEPIWFQQFKSSHPELSSTTVYFNTYDGEGICGGTIAPAYTWFSALNSTIQPPSNHPLELRLHPFFRPIVSNQVYVLTFLFPREKAYDSRLLPGYIAKPKVLEPFDLIPRRPPKLNKSKFNMLELSQKNRQQQQYGSGGYQNQQPYQQQQYNTPYNQQQQYGHHQQQQQSASYQQYNYQQNSGRGQQHQQQQSSYDTRYQGGGRGGGVSGRSDNREYGSGSGGRSSSNNNTVSVAAGYQQQLYQQPPPQQQQQQYSRNQPQILQQYSRNQPQILQQYAGNNMSNCIQAPPFYPSSNISNTLNINQQQPQFQQFSPSVVRGNYGYGGGYSSVGDVYSSNADVPVVTQPLMQDSYAYTQVQQQQPLPQYQQSRHQQQPKR